MLYYTIGPDFIFSKANLFPFVSVWYEPSFNSPECKASIGGKFILTGSAQTLDKVGLTVHVKYIQEHCSGISLVFFTVCISI